MEDNKQYMQYVVFFGILVCLVINLNSFEIQSWDEGLYAFRALSIFDSHNMIDQTNGALGGLYSSTSPPLSIWGIFASMNIFGANEFGVRFFSMICSLISGILIYNIAKLFVEKKWALLAPILLNSALIWNNFSRQATTEIPLNMLFLLCFWLICKIYLNNDLRKNIIYAIFFALSFATALLTKITISLFPLLFVLIFISSKELKEKKYLLIGASILALLLASPWYIYMINTYGHEFSDALFLPHISTAVEGNSRSSGIFYYFNLLLINLPILAYLVFIFKVFGQKLYNSSRQFSENFFLINIVAWFVAFLVAFSFSVTKNPHYLTYLIPPIVLLLIYIFDRLHSIELSNGSIIIFLISIFTSFLWSSLNGFRQSFKQILSDSLPNIIIVYFSIILVVIIAVSILTPKLRSQLSYYLRSYGLISTLSVLLLLKIGYNNAIIDPRISFTSQNSIRFLKKQQINSFVLLYNQHNEGDSLFPQMKWYQKHENYSPDIQLYKISPKTIDSNSIKQIAALDNEYILYYADDGLANVEPAVLELLRTRLLMKNFGNYLVFSKSVISR